MSGEFAHATIGTSMTQAEFEAVGLHVCNSQATGDLIYASSASQLSRLPIGTGVLIVSGGIPAWGLTLDASADDIIVTTTGSAKGIKIQGSSSNSGVYIRTEHLSATPAISDDIFALDIYGRDNLLNLTQYAQFRVLTVNVTDGTEEANYSWLLLNGAAGWNEAMTLSAAGLLAVDLGGSGTAAQVDLFDNYDDALVLQQGIQQNNRELLTNIGVLTKKNNGSGYMVNLQPMVRLLAGGIYQTRQMLDNLSERIDRLEKK